jgi:hypothetical protein
MKAMLLDIKYRLMEHKNGLDITVDITYRLSENERDAQ